MNPWTRRALTVLMAVLVLLMAGAALLYRAAWQRYDAALQQLEARGQRLEGVADSADQIQKALVQARREVGAWLHAGDGDAIQNAVQQKVRDLIARSNGTLVSSQVALEPAADGKLAQVRLSAVVTGEWADMVRLLGALQSQQPVLWVRNAMMMREGGAAATQPQKLRLTLQLDAPLAPHKAGA